MTAPGVSDAALDLIRKLAKQRWPSSWLREHLTKLGLKPPKGHGRWSTQLIEDIAAEYGVALLAHPADAVCFSPARTQPYSERASRPPP